MKRNESAEISENQKVVTGYPNVIDKVKTHLFTLSSQTLTAGKMIGWKFKNHFCA